MNPVPVNANEVVFLVDCLDSDTDPATTHDSVLICIP